MKIKNLTFVEKHIEKVAFAVCVLIASMVTYGFVLGTPYSVQIVSTGQVVTADTIDGPLNAATLKLEAALNDPESHLPPMVVKNYTTEFGDRLNRGLAIPNYESPMGPPGLDVKRFPRQDR